MDASIFRRSACDVAVAALAALACGGAAAQTYPARPVKIVVPAQPGGGLDLIGRTVAEQLGRSMGQTFVVDNVSGGGGAIASQTVAHAAPNGYTLMVGYVGTHGTNPAVRKVPYDAVKDFTAIALVGGTPNVLVVQPAMGVSDVQGLLDYAKRNAGKFTYATGGIGTLNHLVAEQFKATVGLDVPAIHYRGIGPSINDFIGGQTQMMMPGLAAAMPYIRAGKMKPIAVTGTKRHPLLPDVPTFEEVGLRGFESVQWYGIVGPAGLPAAITERLNAEINKAMAAPALQKRLENEAIAPMSMSPQQFAAFIQSEIAHWSAVARQHRISLDE